MSIIFLERTFCCKVKTEKLGYVRLEIIFGKNILL